MVENEQLSFKNLFEFSQNLSSNFERYEQIVKKFNEMLYKLHHKKISKSLTDDEDRKIKSLGSELKNFNESWAFKFKNICKINDLVNDFANR